MASFELVRSSRMASRASWIFRWSVSALPTSVFFTSCCAMVDAPCTISPARTLAMTARTMDGTSIGPCS